MTFNAPEPTCHKIMTTHTASGMRLERLIQMSEDSSPDEVLQEASSHTDHFTNLFQQRLQPEQLVGLLKVLVKCSESSLSMTLIKFFSEFDNKLLDRLIAALGEINAQTSEYQSIWGDRREIVAVCRLTIKILTSLVQRFNQLAGKCKNAVTNVKEILKNVEDTNCLLTDVKAIEEMLSTLITKKRQTKLKATDRVVTTSRTYIYAPVLPAPGEFRLVNVLPSPDDLRSEMTPPIRENIPRGKFQDLDTYLDTHFRLLREDFIRPLRLGISEYVHSRSKRIKEIRLYRKVVILRPECKDEGLFYIIQFDNSEMKNIIWDRRLLYGSLLCLSNDNFATMWFAIVKDCDEKYLKNGQVCVQFETFPNTKESEEFIMAESSAYFEAYKHVLYALQSVDDSMPFQRYIIHCNREIKPPTYLLTETVPLYDFGSLVSKANEEDHNVPVLNTAKWPTMENLALDICQYNALRQALTKELAIIQGPPGTGKTFIGLKITQMLLANAQHWSSDKNPILVVCYTNHALDQFLEGILRFSKGGIVRVGGRCKNEALKAHTLKEIKFNRRRRLRSTPKRKCEHEMEGCKRKLKSLSSRLKQTFLQLLPLSTLRDYMTDEQQASFDELIDTGLIDPLHPIYDWLNLSPPLLNQPEELGEKFDDNAFVRFIWINYVVHNTNAMSSGQKKQIQIMEGIKLYDRARLYKSWVLEVLESIADQKDAIERILSKRKIQLDAYVHMIQNEIVHPWEMLQCMPSLESSHQLKQLASAKKFQEWLAIDSSDDSTTRIRDVLSNPTNCQNVLDLGEERELESDHVLCEYESDNKYFRVNLKRNWIVNWIAEKEKEKLSEVLNGANSLVDQQADALNVRSIGMKDRRCLYSHWVGKCRKDLKESIREFEQEYVAVANKFLEATDEETVEILRTKDIIGMTTTGAAKHKKVLEKVQPSIIIVEEAAEVLESHILTAMGSKCKHLILIGDHKQLRPSTTVYELAKDYHLDVSLFERMVNNGMPCVTLSQQHRMRPEISVLMRNNFLYPDIRDSPTVFKYDNVLGVDKNVFFIDHDQFEERKHNSTSYENNYEADFISRLCDYLLKQGYDQSQITVLSPYMGQISVLRKKLESNKGVRVTPVDNFQGEENDIILLSLVRSCTQNQPTSRRNPIGFLKIPNRICVALSRAKKGLYVIGNFSLLKQHSRLWAHNVNKLAESECCGKKLILRCQIHHDSVTAIECPSDFDDVPRSGGCNKPCTFKLPCKHPCPHIKCHINDKDHEKTECNQLCQHVFEPCGHECPKLCKEECGLCEVVMVKEMPVCGHQMQLACHQLPEKVSCLHECKAMLQCGHKCPRPCGFCYRQEKHESQCTVLVEREMPECGHITVIACYEKPDPNLCSKVCKHVLPCSHECTKKCGACYRNKKHDDKCKVFVDRQLDCGHVIKLNCFKDVSSIKCQVLITVQLPCGHQTQLKCYQDPKSIRCEVSCTVKLPCGHETNLNCYKDPEKEECKQLCNLTLQCGHSISTPCYKKESAKCSVKCASKLQCGHSCRGSCSECLQGRIHKMCPLKCDKILPCGHKCTKACAEICLPCQRPCEWVCSHGIKCKNKCSEPCTACQKICNYGCKHKKCGKLCFELCGDIECNEKCTKKLKCGHVCASLCAEVCVCSEFCTERKSKQRRRNRKNSKLKQDKTTTYMRLKTCGCIVQTDALDRHMETEARSIEDVVKKCPNCSKVISSHTKRYSNILKHSFDEILGEFRVSVNVKKHLTGNALYKHILMLGELGLEEEHKRDLCERLEDITVENLRTVDRTVTLLEELLKITHMMEHIPDLISIDIASVLNILTRRRACGSDQFWGEIRVEIRRLQYCIEVTNAYERIEDGSLDQKRRPICDTAMSYLKNKKPLTSREWRIIENYIAILSRPKEPRLDKGTTGASQSERKEQNSTDEGHSPSVGKEEITDSGKLFSSDEIAEKTQGAAY